MRWRRPAKTRLRGYGLSAGTYRTVEVLFQIYQIRLGLRGHGMMWSAPLADLLDLSKCERTKRESDFYREAGWSTEVPW